MEVVQYLIQHGANIQDQNDEGDTPLMRAVDLGCEHVVQYLIDHGANILIQNHSGKTAYKLARIKEIKLILGKRLLQLQRESDSAQ